VSAVGLLVLLAAGALVVWVLAGVVCRVVGWVFVVGGMVGMSSVPGIDAFWSSRWVA
jgi:hypothetical protein